MNQKEQELLKEIKLLTNVNEKMKIIDVTEELLYDMSSEQYYSLLELKKFKYSIQYNIV